LQVGPSEPGSHFGTLIDEAVQAQTAGNFAHAVECYRRILEAEPDHFDATQLLGLAYTQQADPVSAIPLLEKAATINPQHVGTLNNLARALDSVGLHREAVHTFHRALQVDPYNVPVLINLAATLMQLGENRFAARCLMRALDREPDNIHLLFQHARLLHATQQPAAAVQTYRQVIARGLDNFEVQHSLALALQHLGDEVGSLVAWRAAEKFAPTRQIRVYRAFTALQLCDWQEFNADAQALAMPPDPQEDAVCPLRMLMFPLPGMLQRTYVEQFALRTASGGRSLEVGSPPDLSARKPRSGRIRLGYISPDFRNHPVGYLIGALFEHHDRERFEVFAYSCGGPPDSGATRQRIARAVDRFEECNTMTDQMLLQRLRSDDLDILIDLAGYTAHARPRVISARAAPIQVNWLGYPATMGAQFMDYIVADGNIIPPGAESQFTEHVVRLPHTYLPYERATVPDRPLSRSQYALPEDALVLACFGQVRKINPPVFDLWMDVMRRVPQAVLWLSNLRPTVITNLRHEAAAREVDPDRLIFCGPTVEQADHLVRYRLVDVALDTYPYGSHSTAADALFMGCPLVAIAGTSFVSRVSASILLAGGVPELVTTDLEDYHRLILELAQNEPRRKALRERLEVQRSTVPLFDLPLFVRSLERAFKFMQRRREQGLAPAATDVLADEEGAPTEL